MTEIAHQFVRQYFSEISKSSFAPVYLIYGEDFLCQQVVGLIVNTIIPECSKQRHGYEILHQQEIGKLIEIVERLNTYSLFNEKKIIELRDSSIFVNQKNHEKLIHKIKKAYDNSDIDQAVKIYLELLGRLKIDPADINPQNIIDLLEIDLKEYQDHKWLNCVYEESRKVNYTPINNSDEPELLAKVIEKGFPQNNYLIISTDTVNKRDKLFQTIKQIGVVIDCTVAKGSRKTDKDEQRNIIIEHINRELNKIGKEIDDDAFEMMYDKIGFDIRNFSNYLEKLIQYVGDRKILRLQDAEAILNQVRQDPMYELTGAILDRNVQRALFFLSSLLSLGYHPLQILMAIINQIRRLLLIKEFLKSPLGIKWYRGIRFDQFQSDLVPYIQAHDNSLLNYLDSHTHGLWEKSNVAQTKNQKNTSSDLLIIKKNQHPYSIYLMFMKADLFDKAELCLALIVLGYADLAIKVPGQRFNSILEEVIFRICKPNSL